MNLLYEFLRAPPQRASRDLCFLLTIDLHGRRLPDFNESGPVSRDRRFERLNNNVANAKVDMEFDECVTAQDRFDGVACSAVRSGGVEIHGRFTDAKRKKSATSMAPRYWR